jgi:hypothetical protein
VLLIAFSRQTTETDAPISSLLSLMTKVAAIAGGLWLAFNLLALVLTPGMGAIRTLLDQACLFSMPYIVYGSTPRRG